MAVSVTRWSLVRLLGAASLLAVAPVCAEPAAVTPAKTAKAKALKRSASKRATPKSPASKDSANRTDRIGRLIAAARAQPRSIAQRMELISRGLMGVRYVANTLIGGPSEPEQFVVRDDALDCVTFCETVLAAALSNELAEFEATLKRIRYRHGEVRWNERNHYFSDWCQANIENKTCRWVANPDAATIRKIVDVGNLGRRRVSFQGTPRKALLSNAAGVANGDIAGFASQRANLDFFHTGLVMVGADGALLLRHASLRCRRVIEEPLAVFLATNKVRHVALLRAIETASARRG